jgi:hypothetical protein
MPAELWGEATALARELGVHRVKSALGLNYESLRKRVDQRGSTRGAGDTGARSIADFIELNGTQLFGAPAMGLVMEMSAQDGTRLTIRFSAGCQLDVATVVAAFRGARR